MVKIAFEYKIVFLYLLLGTLWILFSDAAVLYMAKDSQTISAIQTYKGWFYVLVTGVLLFFLIRRQLHKMRLHERKLAATNIELRHYQQKIEIKSLEYQNLNEQYKAQNIDLLIAKEKAEENNLLKTAFLQNISHEIRTPMNGIMGFARLLDDDGLTNERRRHYTNIVISSSEQLLMIVNDILTVSLLETKQENVSNEMINVENLVTTVCELFLAQVQQKGLILAIGTETNEAEVMLFADKTKITQILSNLLSNAIKYTKQGFIKCGYTVSKESVTFYVKDSGIGISADMHEKIFEIFRQTELTTSRRFGGTGLGLSICKGFVQLMNGQIWVESEPGVGSTFFFSIPQEVKKA